MSYDGTLHDLHTVEFKRLIPGPIELAWDYLTKPELLRTWFADVTLEPRLGGAVTVRFVKDSCGAGAGVQGTISEFRPPHAIAFSWIRQRPQPDGSIQDNDEGEVRFELAERGEKVVLTLLHSRLPTEELPVTAPAGTPISTIWNRSSPGGARVDFMQVVGRVRPKYDERLAAMLRSGAA